MLKRIQIIILFTLFIFCGKSQCKFYVPKNISKQIKSICDILSTYSVEDEYIGYVAESSIAWKYYDTLKKNATLSELMQLTNYPNPTVRSYSFLGLLDRKINKNKLYNILINHLSDTSKIFFQSGCIGEQTTVGDFMLDRLSYSENNNYKLDFIKKKKIDRLLFWRPKNGINARKEAVINTKITKKNLKRFKKLILNENEGSAMIPIINQNNENNFYLLDSLIFRDQNIAFDLIKENPREQFKKSLIKWSKNIYWIQVLDEYNS